MVGFDYVKTRTLAYVQSYDWLPIIVQFSKICAPSYGVLEYNNIPYTHVNKIWTNFTTNFRKFLPLFLHNFTA